MQKAVLQVNIHENKARKKAMVTVSGCPGVNSVTIDEKNEKMTVIGNIDVPDIVMKLRKICVAKIEAVEPVKKSEEKKPEPKKPDPPKPEVVTVPVMPMYYQHHPAYQHSYYHPHHYAYASPMEEDSQICVIC